jgi:very-short-patch-repair endonuclease
MQSMVEGKSTMLAGPPRTVRRARKLRRAMIVPEVILWARHRLRPGGFKFRRQHPAGAYVLEFTRDAQGVVEAIIAACRTRGNPLHHPADGPPPRSGEERR